MSEPRTGKRSGCAGFVMSVFLFSVLGAVLLGVLTWLARSPYRSFSSATFIELERGTGSKQLAATLEQSGVIRSRYLFWVWKAWHPRARLKAG